MKHFVSAAFLGGVILAEAIVLAPQAGRAQDVQNAVRDSAQPAQQNAQNAPDNGQDLRGAIEGVVRDYLASHPEEIGQIARDYMIKHPEAMGAILAQMLKSRAAVSAGANAAASGGTNPSAVPSTLPQPPDRSAAVASNAQQLFSSPHQVTLGNPDGDVTLVEFFDYNCGYCKRALPDMLSLLKADTKLKIVLKEFPILGPGSVEAARVAVAVRMQDPGGKKYLAFHKELLGSPGPATKEKALAAAKDQGLDMDRLATDMASDEVNTTLSEDMKLASAVGATGTPTYVVGKDVIVGAVGMMGLQGHIEAARAPHGAAAN
jgi:protein-disulfide isomerase